MSKSRLSPEQLRERVYVSPEQAGRRFGHGAGFWIRAFDEGRVEGYRHGAHGGRKLLAGEICPFSGDATPGSCLALLQARSQRATKPMPRLDSARDVMTAWRERRRLDQVRAERKVS